MSDTETAYRKAWDLLRRYDDKLAVWAEEPPRTLGDEDQQVVRLMCNLFLAAISEDPGAVPSACPNAASGEP